MNNAFQTPDWNGYGVTNEAKPAKKRNPIMNALSTAFQFGAPEAFEQGRQKRLQGDLSNALKGNDLGTASNLLIDMGQYDAGMGMKTQMADQSKAAQAEKMRMAYEMTTAISQQPDPKRRFEIATDLAGRLGMPPPTSLADVSDQEIARTLQELKIKGGFQEEQIEGKAINDRLVNPMTGEVMGDYSNPTEQWVDVPAPAGQEGFFQKNEATGAIKRVSAPSRPVAQVSVTNEMPSNKTLTPFQQEQDKIYAQQLAEWNTGGGADAAKQMDQLNVVADALESGRDDLTGFLIGMTPQWALEGLNPDAVDKKELVEEVVQRNLRVVLGAQFTEKEGERLIARAYNSSLPEATNAARLRRLVQQVQQRAAAMQSLNEYTGKYGTSAGWEGSLLTVDQMINEIESAGRSQGGPERNQKRKRWNPATGQMEEVG